MNPIDFIDKLKKLDGAIPYDGDCSSQVIFRLANGKTLRIGITDDDVAETKGIWCDQYTGLAIIGANGPTTDLAAREKYYAETHVKNQTALEPKLGDVWKNTMWVDVPTRLYYSGVELYLDTDGTYQLGDTTG